MQAVFHDRERLRLSSSEQRDQSRTQSKIITRKQAQRPNNNIFKKRKDEEEALPNKDKRCHSSQQLKFVKHTSAEEREQHRLFATTNLIQEVKDSLHDNHKQKDLNRHSTIKQPAKLEKKKSLVFNKFSHRQKEQIRDLLMEIKTSIDQFDINNQLKEYYLHIQAYIGKIQQNNSKLLEVNYFFQKQFNQIMAQKQLSKRVEKCSKNNCLECRYHLQKQNRWKQEKIQLENQIQRLRSELASVHTSKYEEYSQNPSIVVQYSGPDSSDLRLSVIKLKEELEVKDEEYLILLKEFNYLDTINKELKNKMTKVMEEYKYLSIENRTLLNIKTKLIEKEMECTKYKDQRDYFKRKVIDNHRKNQEQKHQNNFNCKCNGRKQQQSIFSLSSASNNLSSANNGSSLSNTASNLDESPRSQLRNTY